MNRQIRFLGVGLCLCFVALFVQLNRLHFFQADELKENPANLRAVARDFSARRGGIFTADGAVVAISSEVDHDLERERRYPQGDLYAHTTGYFSFQFGADGVERVYNDELAGQTTQQQFNSIRDLLEDTDTTANLTLTLRHDVQSVAREALGPRKGAVVVLDPRTGDVLAMWGFPSYDPTVLGGVDLEAAGARWAELDALPPGDDPRLPRAYREIFFPGSTFKPITAAAGLSDDRVSLTRPDFEVKTEYVAPLTTVPLGNFRGTACGGTLIPILSQSCNTAFAEMAAEIVGPDLMIATAERFGFNDVPPLDLPAVAESVFPDDFGAVVQQRDDPPVDIVENTPALAQAGIGQNDVKATPLQMALVAATIANDGVTMTPHVMAELRGQDGSLVDRYDPNVWRTPVSAADARTLRTAMTEVVTSGTAQALQIPGFEVAAKTGTAQVDAARPDDTHAWIIAFAGPPGEEPTVAIAVIVEAVPGQGQQTGGGVAAPIARQVLQQALLPPTPAE